MIIVIGAITAEPEVPTQRRSETEQQQYRTLWAMLEPTSEPPNEEKQVNRDSLRHSALLSKVFQDDSTQVLVLNTTTRDRGDFVCVPWNSALKSLLSTSENTESIPLFAKEVNGDQKTPCQVTDEGLWFYASYIPPFGSKRFDIIGTTSVSHELPDEPEHILRDLRDSVRNQILSQRHEEHGVRERYCFMEGILKLSRPRRGQTMVEIAATSFARPRSGSHKWLSCCYHCETPNGVKTDCGALLLPLWDSYGVKARFSAFLENSPCSVISGSNVHKFSVSRGDCPPSVTTSVLPNGNISLENERVVLVVDSTTGDVVSLQKKTDNVEFVAGSIAGNGDTHYGWGHVEFLGGHEENGGGDKLAAGNLLVKTTRSDRFQTETEKTGHYDGVPSPFPAAMKTYNGNGVVMKEVEVRRSVQLPDGKTAMLRRSYRLFADSDRIHIEITARFYETGLNCQTMVVHFPLNITKPHWWFVDSPFAVSDDKENPIRTHRWYTLVANSQRGVDVMGLDYGDIGLDIRQTETEKTGNAPVLLSFVPLDSGCVTSRYVLCPYIAPPEHSIAAHLGQEAHFPLIAVPVSPLKNTDTAEVTGIVLDNPCLVISDYQAAPDRSGDILLFVTNPTERKERLSLISKEGPLPREWILPAGETVQLRWSCR